MIKLGTTSVTMPEGFAKVLLGTDLVWERVVVGDLIVIMHDGTVISYNDNVVGYPWPDMSAYRVLTGITYDTGVYYKITNFYLKGSDTIRFSFSCKKACNVLGCYTSASATDNYSLYVSTSSGSKYMRYNGGTYNSYFSSGNLNTRKNIVISPTGTSGMPTDSTWTQQNFTAPVPLCIGTTAESATSSKLSGTIYGDIEVDGRLYLIPVERISDSEIGYFDVFTGNFYTNQGSGTPTKLGYA